MKHVKTIDLNCDLGESFGAYTLGYDESMLKIVSSANIACGYHAGDHNVLHQTVQLAHSNKVKVGAHPGFQDLVGFGRRSMNVSPAEVFNLMVYQLGAIAAFAHIHGTTIHHVKPHGALYNMAAKDKQLAQAIVDAVYAFDSNLILYALSGSELSKAGHEKGLRVAEEVFADRTYQQDGTLTPRTQPNALIDDEKVAVKQILKVVNEGVVETVDGNTIELCAHTVCIHGDNEKAVLFAQKLKQELMNEGFTIQAPFSD